MNIKNHLAVIVLAGFFYAHLVSPAHAQSDPSTAPAATYIMGDPPPPPPPPPPPAAAAAPAAEPANPLVGTNPLPADPAPAQPSQPNQAQPAQANNLVPPPPPPPAKVVPPKPVTPRASFSPPPSEPFRPAQNFQSLQPMPPRQVQTPPPQTASQATATQPTDAASKPLTDVFLEPYVFDMREGRRNPFKPYVIPDMASTSTLNLPGTPLERYELDEIKLVGIMWQVKAPKAMFVDPQGEVHVLTKDDRIGRHHGYIAAIREGEVVIIEPGSNVGESAFSTRILQIDRDQKSQK